MPTAKLRVPGRPGRARGVLAATAVATAALALASGAQAAPATARICASQAALYETPGGARVAILHRGDRVRLLTHDDDWRRVLASFGSRGWLRASALCGHHR